MKRNGFTLIELLVVIAIIAMLAAYAIPSYRQYVVQSKRAEAHSKLMEIAGLYEKYYATNNEYPTNVSGGADSLQLTSDFLSWQDYVITQADDAGNNATWRINADAIGAQLRDDNPCRVIWFDNLGRKGPVNSDCWND